MRNFKKRTIALVLASVVTVAGSFASERFKNSLMGLSFETNKNGVMSMVVQTKTGYSGNLTPMKRDANTFILTLPEVDSQAPTPDLTKNPHIQSINIRTMPYTNNGSGYTRITIKTNNLQTLPVTQKIFLPDSEFGQEIQRQKEAESERKRNIEAEKKYQLELKQQQEAELMRERLKREKALAEEQRIQEQANQEEESGAQEEEVSLEELLSEPTDISTSNATQQENNEAFLLILGILLVILCAIYFYIKAKDKMVELSGESLSLDLNEEQKQETKQIKKKNDKKKLNKIKNTIKTLDATYAKSASVQNRNEYTKSAASIEENKPIEEVDVVDLDKLFQEQVQSQKEDSEDENAALEEFLSGFSFDEEYGNEEVEVEEEKELYNVELYEQIINGKFEFNSDDVNCINQLMQTEIADETIRNIKKYLVSNPIKPKSKDKVLEDLVATYAITQNINFTNEDIAALYKIINVEIDSDFITDLRTNPQRTKEVSDEIVKAKNKIRKPSEMVTLKVSDALPNLDEALKKQGNNKIKSDYKPQTVYYSEGYEVATLSISDGLPDLSKELGNKDAYASKPSAKFDLVDDSYEFETLSVTSDLPDLSDVLKNPKNYESKEEETPPVDEKSMLESISNVEFKPFDDNSQNFEILNDFDDFYAVDDSDPNDVLTFEEIAAEFEELYSIKITNDNDYIDEGNQGSENNLDQQTVDVSLIEKELAHFFGTEQTVYEESVNNGTSVDSFDNVQEERIVEKPVENIEIINDEITNDISKQKVSKPETLITEKEVVEPVVELPLVNLEKREKKEIKRGRSTISEAVLNKIQEKRAQREAAVEAKKELTNIYQEKKAEPVKTQTKMCVIENESYDVLSSVSFTANMGCHLAKNSKGYLVVGYIGDKLFQIKTYEVLKSEKIQARMSEKLENGTLRFLVRIGIHKFVLDVENENIKFVMDLC